MTRTPSRLFPARWRMPTAATLAAVLVATLLYAPPAAADPMPLRAAAPVGDDAVAQRIAQLEAQIREQDEALRRVLTLLVDWVEAGDSGRRPDLSALRGNAA